MPATYGCKQFGAKNRLSVTPFPRIAYTIREKLHAGVLVMCTAATYTGDGFYFGRTLDNFCSFGEEIVISPRRRIFRLRNGNAVQNHHAIIGMACVADNYPLYYDAVNECGLCMAGLNFVGNAKFRPPCGGKDNIATFELIPYILGTCATVRQARDKLANINITDVVFSAEYPTAQLHWLIADRREVITLESTESGINLYDNPVGILTNNPTFPEQLFALNNYMALSPKQPQNSFCCKLDLDKYSLGMGAIGLPGDLSSQSRFVRAAFTKLNSTVCDCEEKSLSQFFHILGSVSQTLGCCITDDNSMEWTIYTSCCNADKGIYYYTAYDNRQITAVDMNRVNLDGSALVRYSLINTQQIKHQN